MNWNTALVHLKVVVFSFTFCFSLMVIQQISVHIKLFLVVDFFFFVFFFGEYRKSHCHLVGFHVPASKAQNMKNDLDMQKRLHAGQHNTSTSGSCLGNIHKDQTLASPQRDLPAVSDAKYPVSLLLWVSVILSFYIVPSTITSKLTLRMLFFTLHPFFHMYNKFRVLL